MGKKAFARILVSLLVVVVGIGAYAFGHHQGIGAEKHTETVAALSRISTANTNVVLSSQSMTPSFAINASDSGADHEVIQVKQGARVMLTFNVSPTNVGHDGLQFRSTNPNIDTDVIFPGKSKTVAFTATKAFGFGVYNNGGMTRSYKISVTIR